MGIVKLKSTTAVKPATDTPDRLRKIQIVRCLQEVVHHQLYEVGSWPMGEVELMSFHALLEQMGLDGKKTKKNAGGRLTALGKQCEAHVALCLLGAYEPQQIPLLLRLEGLISDAEVDAFIDEMSRCPEADIWMRVEPLVYRAHHRWRRSRMGLRMPQP